SVWESLACTQDGRQYRNGGNSCKNEGRLCTSGTGFAKRSLPVAARSFRTARSAALLESQAFSSGAVRLWPWNRAVRLSASGAVFQFRSHLLGETHPCSRASRIFVP